MAQKREAYYETVLARYAGELKPGMTRLEVERHLQNNGARFRQLCCVNPKANFAGAGWDDLVEIGREDAPWFCSENNVYVAFEFNPKSQGEAPETNPSDILRRISVFHSLEKCL